MQLEDRLHLHYNHLSRSPCKKSICCDTVFTCGSRTWQPNNALKMQKRAPHVFAFARCLTPQSHIPPCISDKYADRSCRNSAFSDLDMLLPMVFALQCDFLFLDYGACCLRVPSEDRWIFPRALHMLHHEFHLGFNIDRSSRCVLRISRRRLFKLENGAQFLRCKLHDYRCHTANYARSCWSNWYSITSHLLILSAKQN